MDHPYHIEIDAAHPHYTVAEIFSSSNHMVRGFFEKNYSKKLHSQEFYEINIILRGSATHYVDERRITVCKGDVFIIPPHMMHGYLGGEGFDIYHVLLSPQYLQKYAATLQPLSAFSMLFKLDPLMRSHSSTRLHFRLCEEELAPLMSRLDVLAKLSYHDSYVDALICEGESLALIAELCDIDQRHTHTSTAVDTEDGAFIASIAYLYEHFGKKLTIETLSRIAQMSRNTYIARFKHVMGDSPAHFIKLYRVDMIKQMLRGTALSEEEIALATGCSDVPHMIRLFSSETGVTPSRYRKENRE